MALGFASSTAAGVQPQLDEGQAIFRFDTFGDEQLWTDVLRMHEVLQKVPPITALQVGLKVDSDALPAEVKAALAANQVDLNNPAVTVELLLPSAIQRDYGERYDRCGEDDVRNQDGEVDGPNPPLFRKGH